MQANNKYLQPCELSGYLGILEFCLLWWISFWQFSWHRQCCHNCMEVSSSWLKGFRFQKHYLCPHQQYLLRDKDLTPGNNALNFHALLKIGGWSWEDEERLDSCASLMAFSFQGHFQSIFHLLCCDWMGALLYNPFPILNCFRAEMHFSRARRQPVHTAR